MLSKDQAELLAIHTMTLQVLGATTRVVNKAPLSNKEAECLNHLIQALEQKIAFLSWISAGCQPLQATDDQQVAMNGPDTFFIVITTALEPSEDDAPIFVDQLNQLRATAELLRERSLPTDAELDHFRAALTQISQHAERQLAQPAL